MSSERRMQGDTGTVHKEEERETEREGQVKNYKEAARVQGAARIS